MADEPDGYCPRRRVARGRPSSDLPAVLSWVPKLGIGAWSFVGFVVATAIVVGALGCGERDRAASDVRGGACRDLQAVRRDLKRHKLKASGAAGLIVLGLLP